MPSETLDVVLQADIIYAAYSSKDLCTISSDSREPWGFMQFLRLDALNANLCDYSEVVGIM